MKVASRVLALALLTFSLLGEADAVELSSDLASRVVQGQSTPVWVFFVDKGGETFSSDYPSTRALDRRAKMRESDSLLDWRDLPLSREYLNFFENRSWPLRNQSRWLNAVSLEADAAVLEILAEQDFVKHLAPVAGSRKSKDLPLENAEAVPGVRDTMIDYGLNESELEQIRVPEVHQRGYYGQGVIIGMLDTGCNTQHEALQNSEILGTWDFIQNDEIIFDQLGDVPEQDHHGSRTFSTLAAYLPGLLVGVAFEASYYLAKTEKEGSEYPVEEDYWVSGLEWLEAQGCDIVNSSIGYKDWYSFSDMDGNTALSTIAADHAASLGVLVVAAVGNERYEFGHIIAPSDGDSVLAVGAVDSDGDYSWFSSPGPSYDGRIKPDVMARGQENYTIDPSSYSGYLEVSGTSYCTALASGVAALVLCANPEAGPMELIEAMRQTADHAGYPNNDYGWGVLDALAAIDFFKPRIVHTALPDTEDSSYGYSVVAKITSLSGSIVETDMSYRVNGGEWCELLLDPMGDDFYGAMIPAQYWGSTVDYYLGAENDMGMEVYHPEDAPESWHSFYVGEDLLAPVIEHDSLGEQAIPVWPATVEAQVTDNLGLALVICESWLNGERQADFELLPLGASLFEGEFTCGVVEGDSLRYRIVATDAAQAANQAAHPSTGEHAFVIRGEGGLVLLLEDGENLRGSGGKPGPDKEWMPEPPPRERTASADWTQEALIDAGYLVQREILGQSDPELWTAYDLLVICTSDRDDPLNVDGVPAALESYAAGGGRLLCEGGELAYKFRQDSSFLNTVLHASGWLSDYGGNLELAAPNHSVANYPYQLPGIIPFNYEHYCDQDLVAPAPDATLVYGTNIDEFAAGVVVHDMDPDHQGGQSVFLPFNLGRIPETEAKHLIRNSAAWLLTGFTGGSGQVSGNVILNDQGDHSDVLVTLTGQDPWLTDTDGSFQFEGVWTGNVLLHAEKSGYADVDSVLTLTEGQVIDGIVLELQPVLVLDYLSQPELSIPDNYPVGVADTIWVSEAGTVLSLNVDVNLSHTYIGDLRLKLISPTGTPIILHNRSGGSSDNIVGNYPLTLVPVDDLGGLQGETINGPWVLKISDHAPEDLGTLHSWGLHISVPNQPTGTEDVHKAFALRGNWPNPFNPSTRLEFNLAEPGHTILEIFDLRGRRLALLCDESLAAGTYSMVWHGTDHRGRALSSGVYFARLRSDEGEAVHKMLLLK